MATKELGKISRVCFGLGGYQDCMLGLSLDFTLGGSGVGTFIGFWDCNLIEHTNCDWTETTRDKKNAETMRVISKLLHEAKVDDVMKLKGIPVEVTMESRMFKSFRILTEVL